MYISEQTFPDFSGHIVLLLAVIGFVHIVVSLSYWPPIGEWDKWIAAANVWAPLEQSHFLSLTHPILIGVIDTQVQRSREDPTLWLIGSSLSIISFTKPVAYIKLQCHQFQRSIKLDILSLVKTPCQAFSLSTFWKRSKVIGPQPLLQIWIIIITIAM